MQSVHFNNRVSEFVAQLKATTDIESASRVLSGNLAEFGFEKFTYGMVSISSDGNLGEPLLLSNLPEDWMNTYEQFDFGRRDYNVLHCTRSTHPLPWSSLDGVYKELSNGRFYSAATNASRDFGIRHGVTVPLQSLRILGAGAAVISDSATSEHETDREFFAHQNEISTILTTFHTHVDVSLISSQVFELSTREREVLRWLADGIKFDAIADKLGTARSTVEKQALSARRKMRSATLTQAVVKAALFDLL